jgi:hypothetical protein
MQDWYAETLVWAMRTSYALPILGVVLLRYEGINKITALGVGIYCSFVCMIELYFALVPVSLGYSLIGMYTYVTLYPTIILAVFTLLLDRPLEKRISGSAIALFLVTSVLLIWHNEGVIISPIISVVGLLLILASSVYFLYKTFRELKVKNLVTFLPFWFCAAFLFHAAATYFLFLFQEILLSQDIPEYRFLWQIQYYTAILFNLTISIGLWKTRLRSSLSL